MTFLSSILITAVKYFIMNGNILLLSDHYQMCDWLISHDFHLELQ